MRAESRIGSLLLGLVGISASSFAVGITLWFTWHPGHSDLAAYVAFGLGGITLLAVPSVPICRSLMALKRSVESIHAYIEEDVFANRSSRVSWDQFSRLVLDLLVRILFEHYLPDLVVGVGRSGGVVATMLAGCLRSCRVLVVDVEIDKEAGTRTLHPESKAALASIPGEFKVLIAMADVITGGSVKAVREALPETVEQKVAAIYRGPGASVEPDFLIYTGPTPPEWPFRLISTFGYRFFTWPDRAAPL